MTINLSVVAFFQVIAEAVRTTLGPRGMDKLMVDGRGEERGMERIRERNWLVYNTVINNDDINTA